MCFYSFLFALFEDYPSTIIVSFIIIVLPVKLFLFLLFELFILFYINICNTNTSFIISENNNIFFFCTLYIITFLLSLIFLDRKIIIGIIYASIVYPLFVYLTEDITNIITLNYSDMLLLAVMAGIISGISNGLTYRNGFASSGLAVIAPIIHKYFKVSISLTNFIVNSIIVLLGGFFFGFNNVLYAIILIYLSSYICNVIILGISTNKIMFIKTNKEEDINRLLIEKYHITSTIFKEGNNNLLMVVMSNRMYAQAKRDFLLIDKDIHFITNDCYELVKNTINL